MTSEKIDLARLHKDEFAAPKKPRLLTVGPARYLALEGRGKPDEDESSEFHLKIGHMFAVAYTLKFQSKARGRDYVVCKLQSHWWGPKNCMDMAKLAPEKWRWKLLVRVPEFIDEKALAEAFAALAEKGHAPGFQQVRLETLEEGRCVQMLHVGPYDEVGRTVVVMEEFAKREGLELRGPHHEIYLSDPRRVEPARLRTIVRHPVD